MLVSFVSILVVVLSVFKLYQTFLFAGSGCFCLLWRALVNDNNFGRGDVPDVPQGNLQLDEKKQVSWICLRSIGGKKQLKGLWVYKATNPKSQQSEDIVVGHLNSKE